MRKDVCLFVDTTQPTIFFSLFSTPFKKDIILSTSNNFTELYLQTIKKLFNGSPYKIKDVNKIFFCTGPGRFTGIKTTKMVVEAIHTANKNVTLYACNSLLLQTNGEDGISLLYAGGKFWYHSQCCNKKLVSPIKLITLEQKNKIKGKNIFVDYDKFDIKNLSKNISLFKKVKSFIPDYCKKPI